MILKYKERLLKQHPREAVWVYDLATEMPEWNERKQEYVFKRQPKRIDPREAKQIIADKGLKCVCDNKYGRIYA